MVRRPRDMGRSGAGRPFMGTGWDSGQVVGQSCGLVGGQSGGQMVKKVDMGR